jgi:hypothetical protein
LPSHKNSQYEDFLLSHNEPTHNKTISYFKGDQSGREKHTEVLDHVIKLKQQQTKEKEKQEKLMQEHRKSEYLKKLAAEKRKHNKLSL